MPVEFNHKQFSLCSPTLYLGDPKECNSEVERKVIELIHELARVGWCVPGITVNFRTSGQGQTLLRLVDSINGVIVGEGPFRFGFGYSSGQRVGNWFVHSLPNDYVVPPGICLHTYDDHSADSLAHYKKSTRWNSLTAVPYVPASTDENFTVNNQTNGSHRWATDTSIEYCVNNLLEILAIIPDAPGCRDIDENGHDVNLRRLAHVEVEPVPDGFPLLYVWAQSDDCNHIANRRQDMIDNGPDRDYVLHGNGRRLLSLGTHVGDVHVSSRAFDGFDYGSTDFHSRVGHHSMGLSGSERLPVEVKLRALNDIFVVDGSRYEAVRKELAIASEAAGRDSFNDAEIDLMNVAVARTMVPASQYDGSYIAPTYLIGRQIGADEARLMGGNVRLDDKDGLKVVVTDRASGVEFVAREWHLATPHTRARMEKHVRSLSDLYAQAGNLDFELIEDSSSAPVHL